MVSGFQDATDVSVKGLKYSVSSKRLTLSPNPCEDFLPTNCIGSLSNSPGGPFDKVAVGILNILKIKVY